MQDRASESGGPFAIEGQFSKLNYPFMIAQTPNDRDKRSRLKQKYSRTEDDYELSRFKPMVKQLIEVSRSCEEISRHTELTYAVAWI